MTGASIDLETYKGNVTLRRFSGDMAYAIELTATSSEPNKATMSAKEARALAALLMALTELQE